MPDPRTGTDARAALRTVLEAMGDVAVAVSGGVDSLALATFAHRLGATKVSMFHATSAAVPAEATLRTQMLADREGWALRVIDAGEFQLEQYRANPVNRCFHCKTSLYGAIVPATSAQVVSGTNLDDLGEYRPGLEAARQHGVRHPFVEAGLTKADVRALARELGLGEIAELPSAPCLSSRIETGIAIDPAMLGAVHAAEKLVAATLDPATVRCRVRASGVVIELDRTAFDALEAPQRDGMAAQVSLLFKEIGLDPRVRFEPYRTGSAFLVRELKAVIA